MEDKIVNSKIVKTKLGLLDDVIDIEDLDADTEEEESLNNHGTSRFRSNSQLRPNMWQK